MMNKQNTLAVNKFIIHKDVNKTIRTIASKCRLEISLRRARVIYTLLSILSIIFMFMGYIEIDPILTLSSGIFLCIITVCFYSLVDLRSTNRSISYKVYRDAYNRINGTYYDNYNSMIEDNNLSQLLPGVRLMNIIYEHQLHHVSVTKNGNLAFIFDDGINQVSTSITVDASKIQGATSAVNIIVDACYIKAVPV